MPISRAAVLRSALMCFALAFVSTLAERSSNRAPAAPPDESCGVSPDGASRGGSCAAHSAPHTALAGRRERRSALLLAAQLADTGLLFRRYDGVINDGNWLLESLLWVCVGNSSRCKDQEVLTWVLWNTGVQVSGPGVSASGDECQTCHYYKLASSSCALSSAECDPSLIAATKALSGTSGAATCLCAPSAAQRARVERCVDVDPVFAGQSPSNQWVQFIDGRDHHKGPRAYDLKEADIDNATLFVSGPASHGAWLDKWDVGYAALRSSCAARLTVPLLISIFVPLYLGEDENALAYLSQRRQGYLWRDRPLGRHFMTRIHEMGPVGLGIDELMFTSDPTQVHDKFEHILAHYNGAVEGTRDGSPEAVAVIATFARRLHFLHPFQDGNARMVSILLDRELTLHGHCPVSMYNNLPHFAVSNTDAVYRAAVEEVSGGMNGGGGRLCVCVYGDVG